MAQQPPTVHQQIAALTAKFPMGASDKDAAIELALRNVDPSIIAAVADALDIAIPVHAWKASDAIYPELVAEHAVEQGRYMVVTTLKEIVAKRTKQPE